MGRQQEAANLLKQGRRLEDCADAMGVSISSTIDYLLRAVGWGLVKRSDILFAMDPKIRNRIERSIAQFGTTNEFKLEHAIRASGERIDPYLLRAYLMLRDARIALGDMYEIVRQIEITLHKFIKAILVSKLGSSWWKDGIPSKIRVECARLRELDDDPITEPYCYTTLIQLDEILQSQWKTFKDYLPGKVASDRKRLSSNLAKINHIRNRVMHPVRGDALSEEDFCFVREVTASLELDKWDEVLRAVSISQIKP